MRESTHSWLDSTHVYSTIIWLIFCLRQHYLLLLPIKTTQKHIVDEMHAFFTATFLF